VIGWYTASQHNLHLCRREDSYAEVNGVNGLSVREAEQGRVLHTVTFTSYILIHEETYKRLLGDDQNAQDDQEMYLRPAWP
jgi:hypothetical protein